VLADIPLIGEALFDQPWPLYLVYPLVPFVAWLLYRTRWGLEIRAVGENPNSADVSGIHVNKRRRQAIYLAGLTSGLGGGYLLLGQVGSFEDSMTGFRGFIAIAAVIFFFGYKIDDSHILKMQEEIAARKACKPAEA